MFPTHTFRLAYDALRGWRGELVADVESVLDPAPGYDNHGCFQGAEQGAEADWLSRA